MDDNENISKWVRQYFDFSEKLKVKLLRSYTNDVYEIEDKEKYLLKIYGEGWRAESEVKWEIKLIDFLKKQDVRVAGAMEGKAGKLLTIEERGRTRTAVMFEWADGKKPEPPFSLNDYELLGRATAKIHHALDSFHSNERREELGIGYLIDRPLATIMEICKNDTTLQFFREYALKLRDYLQRLIALGLDWGVVHDDVTFDNIHITDSGEVVFYDFDSAGLGWRAIDLEGWAVFDPKTRPRQEAFIKGYREIRDISGNDVVASPYFHAANEFWGVALDLKRRVLKNGEEATQTFLEDKINSFKLFDAYFTENHTRKVQIV